MLHCERRKHATTNLLRCWHHHFHSLDQSRHYSRANNSILDTDLLFNSSFANKDGVLDEDLTIEEVERAINSLRNGKSSGANGVTAKYF